MRFKQRRRFQRRKPFEYCEVVVTENGDLKILSISPSTSTLFFKGIDPILGEDDNKIFCG